MDEDSRYGIDVRRFCREHEACVRGQAPSAGLLEWHLEKLRWLQHERLIHLIVTVMVVFVEAFVTGLVLLHPELSFWAAIVMLGLAVLLGFYFRHYFFLENTVQKWYLIAEELREQIGQSGGADGRPDAFG
ncbi:MAG: hypothetical protein K6E30_02410 [Lachnospiraceae bacterium]|nr:hypothetical protein [Lachnospiraceae bacterium]